MLATERWVTEGGEGGGGGGGRAGKLRHLYIHVEEKHLQDETSEFVEDKCLGGVRGAGVV